MGQEPAYTQAANYARPDQLFQLLFERSVDAHLLIAGDQLLDCNQAAVALLGYPGKAALMAAPPSAFSADPQPDGRSPAEHLDEIGRALAANGSHRFEWLHRRADGALVPVEVSLTEIVADEQVLGHAVLRDITRRRQQESVIQAANARLAALNRDLGHNRDMLRALFDGFDDGLLLVEHDGRVALINRAFAALLDCAPARITGRRWTPTARRIAPGFPRTLPGATLRDGRPRQERTRYLTPSGQLRVLELHAVPLHAPGEGRPKQVLLRAVDLTERMQLEAMAVQHERFAANARLAAAVAHEIKSPLQAIQTLLYLAQQEISPERADYVALAHEEIVRLGEIAGRLLHHYRPDASSVAPVDLNALAERVLLLTGGLLTRANVAVARAFDPRLPLARGRVDQLTQVLLNLIFNAVDAMPQGGALHVRSFRASAPADSAFASVLWVADADDADLAPAPPPLGPVTALQVSDQGPGIEPQVLARLFVPFFSTKPQGAGLGLAISRRIVAQHGGALGVRSTPGLGSSFLLLLPLAEASDG
jgi:PAS domain S-box-containing protein